MLRYKRLLVALSLDKTDAACLRWAATISRISRATTVFFVHVAETLTIPDAIRKQYPGLIEPLGDTAEAKMRELAEKHFAPLPGCEMKFDVTEGSPAVEILRRVAERDIDLVVVGKAAGKADAGAVPEKLARRSPASVMIAHEQSDASIGRILAPLDFSDHCADAFNVVLDLARAADGVDVRCLHAYPVPRGYHKLGKTREGFAEIMRENAEQAYQEFIARFDREGLNMMPTFAQEDRPLEAIQAAIESERPDIVVMGAHGRTASAAVLLGSTTERLIRSATVPLLAVKRKGEGMGFLEALMKL